MSWGDDGFPRYLSVAGRTAQASAAMAALRQAGWKIAPVKIDGRKIATSFWGKAWCDHLESFSDYVNRLPRGRTYARNGSVCHLSITSGRIEAFVGGSEIYELVITITPLAAEAWTAIKQTCAGSVGSLLELLKGRISTEVMTVVTDREHGMFPKPSEIRLDCSCPDWAGLCKHLAAVLYGVGHRLDTQPDLLFTLRGVDPQELVSVPVGLPDGDQRTADTIAENDLSEIFGIDFDGDAPTTAAVVSPAAAQPLVPKRKAAKGRSAKAGRYSSKATATASRSKARGTKSPRVRNRSARTKQQPFKATGRAVRALRKKLDLSVKDFAVRVGVSAACVRRWEGIDGDLKLQARSLKALQAAHRTA